MAYWISILLLSVLSVADAVIGKGSLPLLEEEMKDKVPMKGAVHDHEEGDDDADLICEAKNYAKWADYIIVKKPHGRTMRRSQTLRILPQDFSQIKKWTITETPDISKEMLSHVEFQTTEPLMVWSTDLESGQDARDSFVKKLTTNELNAILNKRVCDPITLGDDTFDLKLRKCKDYYDTKFFNATGTLTGEHLADVQPHFSKAKAHIFDSLSDPDNLNPGNQASIFFFFSQFWPQSQRNSFFGCEKNIPRRNLLLLDTFQGDKKNILLVQMFSRKLDGMEFEEVFRDQDGLYVMYRSTNYLHLPFIHRIVANVQKNQ